MFESGKSDNPISTPEYGTNGTLPAAQSYATVSDVAALLVETEPALVLYRPLGQTGLNVSMIGFGASPLGNVFGSVRLDEGNDAVQYAIEQGINYFDVSPYYGTTLAEERLGAALAGRRHEVVLATKCGRYGVDHFDFSPETITREFDLSLQRLRTDHVDLLQVHDVEFGSMDQILGETLPAMRRLQQQGKARFIGITGYWPALLARMAETVPVDTVLNYCHFNLLMSDMDDELAPAARRHGWGLVNASPLHMGLLGGAEVPAWHPASPHVRRVAAEVVALCRQHTLSPATVALHACLDHDAIASTLIGLSSVSQVNEALNAVDSQPPAELMTAIRALVVPIMNTVWTSGLAENNPAGSTHP